MDGELPFSMLDVIALLNLPYPMPLHIGLSRKAISVQSALVHPYACQSSPSTSG